MAENLRGVGRLGEEMELKLEAGENALLRASDNLDALLTFYPPSS
jgi:hypothetical protein